MEELPRGKKVCPETGTFSWRPSHKKRIRLISGKKARPPPATPKKKIEED